MYNMVFRYPFFEIKNEYLNNFSKILFLIYFSSKYNKFFKFVKLSSVLRLARLVLLFYQIFICGLGFGMQASQYIFLRRDVDVDLKRMSRAVDYYSAMGRPYQVQIFFLTRWSADMINFWTICQNKKKWNQSNKKRKEENEKVKEENLVTCMEIVKSSRFNNKMLLN